MYVTPARSFHARSLAAVMLALAALMVAFVASPSSASAATPSANQSHAVKTLEARLETSMLAALNAERRSNHLPALRSNKHLAKSAATHSLSMAKSDTMSHQLRSESSFGNRVLKAGYNWQTAGENIGWTTDETARGIVALEQTMYHEKAPDNGHRLNILSRNFRDIGINVYVDTVHHKIWFTQDMGKLM